MRSIARPSEVEAPAQELADMLAYMIEGVSRSNMEETATKMAAKFLSLNPGSLPLINGQLLKLTEGRYGLRFFNEFISNGLVGEASKSFTNQAIERGLLDGIDAPLTAIEKASIEGVSKGVFFHR